MKPPSAGPLADSSSPDGRIERDSRLPLDLAADVLQRLLPHRRPFLMVDRVHGYLRGDRPTLWASRYISANEPVFEGHFPQLSLWPGVLTIEGMGQTSNILAIFDLIERGLSERGADPALLLDGLNNLQRRTQLHPGYRPELEAELEALLRAALPSWSSAMGMNARVDVKLLAPVFAGQRLDYVVTRTHVVDQLLRFEVRAEVAGRQVAGGVMTSTFGQGPKSHGGRGG